MKNKYIQLEDRQKKFLLWVLESPHILMYLSYQIYSRVKAITDSDTYTEEDKGMLNELRDRFQEFYKNRNKQ